MDQCDVTLTAKLEERSGGRPSSRCLYASQTGTWWNESFTGNIVPEVEDGSS